MGLPFENADYNEDEVGARKIPELTDVVLTDVENDNVLVYNNGIWENKAQSSSITELNDIPGVTITNVQDNQFLKYDSGEWINSNITDNDTDNLNDLTDTLLTTPFGEDEVLKYSGGKWVNGNIPLEKLSNVHISNLQDGETLRYVQANGRWENVNNIDTLNELSDVNVSSNLNNQVLKYNNQLGVYKNDFLNLTDLGDTNITTLANGNTLIYNNGEWSAGNITYTETDPVFTGSPVGSIIHGTGFLKNNGGTWSYDTNTYLTSYTETDPVFTGSPVGSIIHGTGFLKNNGGTWSYDNNVVVATASRVATWDTAYGWGDHAIQNYLKTTSPAGSIIHGTGFLKNNGGTWSYDNIPQSDFTNDVSTDPAFIKNKPIITTTSLATMVGIDTGINKEGDITAFGKNAGYAGKNGHICIGESSGTLGSTRAISLGYNTHATHVNSVVIHGGNGLSSSATNAFYIDPLRTLDALTETVGDMKINMYNTSTKEIFLTNNLLVPGKTKLNGTLEVSNGIGAVNQVLTSNNTGALTWTDKSQAEIYNLSGLTWLGVGDNELIRRVDATNADGAGMTLHDTSSPTFPQTSYYKDVSYFGRHGLLTIPFGVNRFESSFAGHNQRLIPYSPILLSTTLVSGLYLHHLPSINDYNVRVGVNNKYPSQDFQVGTTLYVDDTYKRVGINQASPTVDLEVLNTMYVDSNTRKVGIVNATPTTTFQVGTTLYVDETTGRVGIGIPSPEENLEVDGSIQIDSNGTARLKFQQTGQTPYAVAEIDAEPDGNGGQLEFFTSNSGMGVSKKMVIRNDGATEIYSDGIGLSILSTDGFSQQAQIYHGSTGTQDLIIDTDAPATTTKGISFRTQAGVQRLRIGCFGELGFSPTNDIGLPGQILESRGQGNTPRWVNAPPLPASPIFTNVTANEIDGGVTNVSIKLNDTSQGARLLFNSGYPNLFLTMRNDEFNCYFNGSPSGLYLNYNGGAVYYGNPASQLSDDRVKFNETNITNGLEVIRKLSPERYTKRLPTQTIGTEEAGFIAQEVMAIPELKFAVKHPDKELIPGDPNTRYYAVEYDNIFTYAVAGLKELDTIVQQQAVLIKSLEARIKTLEGK